VGDDSAGSGAPGGDAAGTAGPDESDGAGAAGAGAGAGPDG
jgi:hypothetical protein